MHYTDITDLSILSYIANPQLIHVFDLDHNEISSIEGVNRFTNLRILGLFTNKILNISRSNFTGLGQLTFLNLPGNLIDVIWEDTFRDLPSLKRLNLDVNPLVTISPRTLEYLPNFQSLKLPSMHCDCNLQWLSIVYNTYGLSINPLSYCGSPSDFSGYHVYDSSIYENCSSPFKYSCFDKNREPCNDGSYCRDTPKGSECVCEGENTAYSRANGGKCYDIDEIIRTISDCENDISLDQNFNVECVIPKHGP